MSRMTQESAFPVFVFVFIYFAKRERHVACEA